MNIYRNGKTIELTQSEMQAAYEEVTQQNWMLYIDDMLKELGMNLDEITLTEVACRAKEIFETLDTEDQEDKAVKQALADLGILFEDEI